MNDPNESAPQATSDWNGLDVAIDQVTLEDLCEKDQLDAICQGFSALNDIGLKVVSQSGKEIVDVSRAGGLIHWLLSLPRTQQNIRAFLNHLNQMPLDIDRSRIVVEPMSELHFLVLPLAYDFDVIGRLICGPYTVQHQMQLPAALGITDAYESQRYRVLRGAIPRRQDETIKENMSLLMRTLSSMISSGYRASVAANLHYAAMSSAYEALQDKNKELTQKNQALLELSNFKNQFLATLSHELRTPLTTILANSELLLQPSSGVLNDAQCSFLGSILDSGTSLNQLIGNLLHISEMDTKLPALHVGVVRPQCIFQQVLSAYQTLASRAQITFTGEMTSEPPQVRGDRHKMRQTLDQVIQNAIKFTSKGGHVTLSLKTVPFKGSLDGKGVAFFITDDGIGIDASEQVNIFKPFYQVDRSETRAYAGTGIGLHLAKRLMDAQQGTIEVKSALGEGSTFILTFPCKLNQTPSANAPTPSGIFPAIPTAACANSTFEQCKSSAPQGDAKKIPD